MTEYGRGPGSDPWHPDDPLYGDGWNGQQPQGGADTYGGQPQQPQQSYENWGDGGQPGYQQQYDTGQHQQPSYDAGGHQQYDTGRQQQPYGTGQHQQYGTGGHQQPSYGTGQHQQYDTGQHQQPYGTGQHQQYGTGQHEQSYGTGGQQPYGTGGHYDGQYDGGGWDTGGQGQVPYDPAAPADPYQGQHPQGGQQDYYGAQGPYAGGQQHQGQRGAQPQQPGQQYPDQQQFAQGQQGQQGAAAAAHRPEPQPRRAPEAEPETDWDPGPDQGEHAFFSGADDEDDDDGLDTGRRGRANRRSGGGESKKKRRGGCACLVGALLISGGIGGIGYFGYQFYQDRFGPAPDYVGNGSGSVTVEIPQGASGYEMGAKLKKAGVVKSVDAFVDAQGGNPKGGAIQDGVYTLRKKMSASSVVTLMLDPKSRNALIIFEGMRDSSIYEQIDTRLGLRKGTTKRVALKEWRTLGLPDWAIGHKDVIDPLEGFLYPSAYPVAKGMKPQAILKKMVSRAVVEYDSLDVEGEAKRLHLDGPWEVVTIASLVQAEGKYKPDFDKVATVVYNRLKPSNTETYGLLDFDSTVNYLRGKSELATGSVADLRKINHPYNTYKIKGLPPGPIGNPGDMALQSTIHPATGNWYYFVSVSADKTLFAETNEEQNRNREKYLKGQR